MKATTILMIVLLTWSTLASAQDQPYDLFGDDSFPRGTYNSHLLNELNTRGAKGYKLVNHWSQSKEAGNGLETVFLMEHQSGTYKYDLVGDESFPKEHYNANLLRELNKKGAEGYKFLDHWQQSKEAGNGLETVFLMEGQSGRYKYFLVGDGSFHKEHHNSELLAELNKRATTVAGLRVVGRWQQRQEANSSDEIVYLLERTF